MSKIYLLTIHTLIIQVECYSCDFEDACIKAFVEAFPDGATDCCFFHLAQAHWCKIMDMRLRARYIEGETLSLNSRMFTALAFVPPDDIVSVGSTTYASHCKPDGTMVPN